MKSILVDVRASEASLKALKAIPGIKVTLCEPVSEEARALPLELVRDQHILFCSSLPENFKEMKQLEWVQLCSAGYEQLIGWNFPQRQIHATNASGVFDVPIGEWCYAMMVNLARDLRGMIRNQDKGHWDRSARFQQEIRGKVVGFWGYGGLAREAARISKAAGMQVHVLSRHGIGPRKNSYAAPGTGDIEGLLPDHVFGLEERFEFLKGLDFLILAMPLNEMTRGMVGEGELRALPRHAFLLNPARGPLVQEQALIQALSEGWFAGAALDTHFAYPLPPEHPLWKMTNVLLTPHISGSNLSPHFLPRVWDVFTQNVQRFVGGEPLLNELTCEQLTG